MPTASGIKVKRQTFKSAAEDGSLVCYRLDLRGATLEAEGLGAGWRLKQLRSGWGRNVIRLAVGFTSAPEIRIPKELRMPRSPREP